jgi:hypothetical protein
MLSHPNKYLLCGVICTALALLGCSTRKPIVSNYPSFRLESLNGDSLLLTPAIPASQSNKAGVTLTLASAVLPTSTRANCSAERGPFRIGPGKADAGSMEVVLPAPEAWLSDLEGRTEPDSSEDVEALDAILTDVDRLQQQGCFTETPGSIREFILQSVPMRPHESFYNAYGYRVGHSGLALKPEIRLKIERAYFRPAATGGEEHDPRQFLGLSTAYFDVELAGDNQTRFQQVGDIRYSPASLAHTVESGSRDLVLGTLPKEALFRLFFYTYLVPQKHKRSAVIMGASNASQLDRLDSQLRVTPDESCESVASEVTCLEFDGFVTLSSQIRVELNGKTEFLEWGAKVRDVLPKNREMEALKSLRIQRLYLNSYRELRFDPKDSHVLSLALVGDDRLTWSARTAASNSR